MVNKFIDFNKAPCIYWSNKLKCDYLQRQILVHSIIYYELNNSVITDKNYDTLCKQLLELKAETENYNETQYYYVFRDFTGETGFYLYNSLNKSDREYLLHIAQRVLKLRGG